MIVIRVLEYEGNPDWLEKTLKRCITADSPDKIARFPPDAKQYEEEGSIKEVSCSELDIGRGIYRTWSPRENAD